MTRTKVTKKVKAGTSKVSAEERKRLFVEAYMSNGRNATAAALAAGYSKGGASKQGYRMSKDPEILSMIDIRRDEILAPLKITTERVLQETARIAFSDIGRIIGPDGKVLLPHELDEDTRAAVSSFKIDEYGRIEYKFWDKNSSSERLFKHLTLYKEDNEQKKPAINIGRIELVPLRGVNDDSAD
jgi:hypothetical protein